MDERFESMHYELARATFDWVRSVARNIHACINPHTMAIHVRVCTRVHVCATHIIAMFLSSSESGILEKACTLLRNRSWRLMCATSMFLLVNLQ